MEQLTANLTGKVRYEELNGRKYIVVPMTMIVPGVLNGSKGPLLYPPEECANNVEAWNGMPIVVYHPKLNGQAISARTPEVLNSQGIGFVFKSNYQDKVVAEGWYDIETTQRVDNRIIEKIEAGEPIELSTGLFTDNEPADEGATYNGKPYNFIARNYRPDHLAVLPDQVGACSLKDGCGVLVNEKGPVKFHFEPTENELSHAELHDMLNLALKARFTQDEPPTWISEVFDDYIIYWKGEELFKLPYTKTDSEVSLSKKSPVKVLKETSFVVANQQETKPMANPELVTELITNCDCWTEDDREVLNAMNDRKLRSLVNAAKKLSSAQAIVDNAIEGFEDDCGGMHAYNPKTGEWDHVAPKEQPTSNTQAPATTNAQSQPLTEEQWLAQAPESIRNVFIEHKEDVERERAELCERIVANEENDEAKKAAHEDLGLDEMSIKGLRRLAAKMEAKQQPVANIEPIRPSYLGTSGGPPPTANRNRKEREPLVPLTVNDLD